MRALLVILGLALLPVAPAAAAPAWLTPQAPFDELSSVGVAQGVMAPDGTVTVIAVDHPGGQLVARVRPPGGPFGPSVPITDPMSSTAFPLLAVATDGSVATTYRQDGQLWASVRRPGQAFDTPTALVTTGYSPDALAVDSDGRAYVAVSNPSGPGLVILVRAPDGSVVSQPFTNGRSAALATRPEGGVTAISTDDKIDEGSGDDCTQTTYIRARDITAEGALQPEQTLATAVAPSTHPGGNPICNPVSGTGVFGPSVASAPSGEMTATYYIVTYGSGGGVVTAARVRPAGAGWDAATAAEPLFEGSDARVAYGGETPVVVGTGEDNVLVTQRTGGAWAEAVDVSPGKRADDPAIGGSAGGTVAIAFRPNTAAAPATGVVRRPDGTISDPHPLQDLAGGVSADLTAGADDAGDAVAGWIRDTDPTAGSAYRPELAGYDGAGPHVDVVGPDSGSAGGTLSFAASATDVWSSISGFAWDFGDGGAGAGAAVSHAFAATGPAHVAVTATDAVGNTGTATRDVTIAPTASPSPSPSPTAAPDTTPPALTKVKVKVRKHRARISFVLSEAATVRALVKRRKHKASRRKGTLAAGKRKLVSRRLRPGRYKLTLKATDAAGNVSKAKTLRFKVR